MTSIADFDYDLPPEMIAQTPVEPRDSSRLMLLGRESGEISHHVFADLPKLLHPGDVLVLNNSRVIRARLTGYKPTGGKVEVLLLKRQGQMVWEALVRGKGVSLGMRLERIGERDDLDALVMEAFDDGRRVLQFSQPVLRLLDEIGGVPLPPYIKAQLDDPERYQTVYADEDGSAAAPTAGLHFTPDLFRTLENRGVMVVKVTLHIGIDTFVPIKTAEIEGHRMHSEWCMLGRSAARVINEAQLAGGRVIAVGTTSARTLETAARGTSVSGVFSTRALIHPEQREPGRHPVTPFSGHADLYIKPGYEFLAMQGMVTNFHLPRSTLLVMVSAFCGAQGGRERLLRAYEEAMAEGYRFYSFGDAMLIL